MQDKIGILDPEGINNNPLNDQPYSDKYKTLAKKWSKLQAYEKIHEVLDKLDKNRVILIKSSTGSGKSVIMPKAVLHYYNYKEKIAMTLPKQIVAQTAAEYAAATLDVELGQEIGYKYKGSPETSYSDKTMILYATDGTIVNKLLNNIKLPEYKCIIIDEAHERKVQIDFLLYLLRNTLKAREDFKLVIMSATIDDTLFKNYFDEFKFGMMDISSKLNYEVKSYFEPKPIEDFVFKSYRIILDIVNKKEEGDILVFVTSVKETEDLCRQIKNNQNLSEIFCIELYSGLSDKQQELATDKNLYKQNNKNKTKKLVIATEVAESSITIDGIVHVIDCGKSLLGGYDPIKRARTLNREFITRSQIKQRKGRAGRTEPGVCYHLYTEEAYQKLLEYPEPAIRVNNITDECLKLLCIPQIETVTNLVATLSEFIEPPSEVYVKSALMQLFEHNLTEKNKVSDLGKIINEIKADIPYAISLLESYETRCSREVLKIVAMINSSKGFMSSIFFQPSSPDKQKQKELRQKTDKMKLKYASSYGDFISLLKIYLAAEKNKENLNKWCQENFIKEKTIRKAFQEYKKLKENLHKVIRQNNIKKESRLQKNLKLQNIINKCFQKGFINQIGKAKDSANYQIEYSRNKVKIGNESFLSLKDTKPKTIFYAEFSIVMGMEKLNLIGKYIKNENE